MFIEICINRDINYDAILKSKFYHKIDAIVLHSSQLNTFPDQNKPVRCLIDYPYGLSNTQIKEHEVLYAIRAGAKTIDLTLNHNYVCPFNKEKLIKELQACYNICRDHNVILRVIIEYRLIPTDIIADLCMIFKSLHISHIIIGTGSMVDDISDNIITCAGVIKCSDISVTTSTNFCSIDNFAILKKLGVEGLRLPTIFAVENLYK